MVEPVRLQLSRKKGFSLQEHSRSINGLPAVKVSRPGKFGNPFTVADAIEAGYAKTEVDARVFVVNCFADWLSGSDQWWQGPNGEHKRSEILAALPDLKGKNVACFCPTGAACHADVLLRLANR